MCVLNREDSLTIPSSYYCLVFLHEFLFDKCLCAFAEVLTLGFLLCTFFINLSTLCTIVLNSSVLFLFTLIFSLSVPLFPSVLP